MTHGSLADYTLPAPGVRADDPSGGGDGAPRRVALLGSTGSIGTQGLDVIEQDPERFRAVALAGGSNTALLAEQAVRHGVEAVGSATAGAEELRAAIAAAAARLGRPAPAAELFTGPEAATRIAAWTGADTVLNGITSSIGLRPTLAALEAGHRLALANKESLIVGGALVKASAAPGQLVPVDSEHSALAQSLRGGTADEVARLVLTASGGPFRGCTREQLRAVTPAQALAHPTWDMGRVVTTNSASLVNKALEVIEAHLLFDVALDRIDVVVHPQSVVHSMVEFTDGSTLAQASPPDMRLPIALGLGWPRRVPGAVGGCDWTRAATWTFEPLDEEVFPAVRLAKEAAAASPTHMAVFNAANEEAVDAFHEGCLSFDGILETVRAVLGDYAPERVLDAAGHGHAPGDLSVDAVLAVEGWARAAARGRWARA
ncbi:MULTISPECIES: 1-deoxy-D-xylulose-5-phosphate reductoisomerase [Micrococcus]|uniref:1-deoxy-D-xylulose-5-phosphate reductoisomerase n=1 Tax=Micrococcus antarcticus TaxID=86171 RepID=UPI00384D4097